ncbi:MAG: 4Fe-4S dicluster domain-containing protein [Deltaproteobacteria bacterium]|jgi:Fe-S-cluster-containing hydrogenase component 2|nr:4Fe-4S dicluster domain-containing protein [Deltaproteobacteria bacterium]
MTAKKVIQVTPSRCVGCLNCELACASRDWGSYFPCGSKINLVFLKAGGQVPVACFQCDQAPCLAVCRTGALARDPDTGVISPDPQKCVGCRACVAVCPFGNIAWSEAGSRIEKCDQCEGAPRCVAVCPSGALAYAEEADKSKARRRLFAESLMEASAKEL